MFNPNDTLDSQPNPATEATVSVVITGRCNI